MFHFRTSETLIFKAKINSPVSSFFPLRSSEKFSLGFATLWALKKTIFKLLSEDWNRVSSFHVFLSEQKHLKSAPGLLSSPSGQILVADWLISCQPLYVIDWHPDKPLPRVLSRCQSFSDFFYFRSKEQVALKKNKKIKKKTKLSCCVKLSLICILHGFR